MVRPLWIEVDLGALGDNSRVIQNYVGKKTKIVATIKQAAYGHGLIPVARQLCRKGIDFFGVGSIEEAVELREDGFTGKIIVLSAVLDEFVDLFIKYDLIPTVVDLKFSKKLNRQAKIKNTKVLVHMKVDTGMGRLGPNYKDAYNFAKALSRLDNIVLEGIYTHFPSADTDRKFTNFQIQAFNKLILRLKKEKINFKFYHCANSIGIMNYPKAHFNMVRPGLILYGVKPSDNIKLKLKPVISLKSKVIFVKEVDKGVSVGYGRSYITKTSRRIGTIAIGYADGYPWSLSNKAWVLIKGYKFKVAGRVCMDHIMVDLGNNKSIKSGDEVILIGNDKGKQITAQDLARLAETISYEIVSRLSAKIPRIYKNPRKH